MPLSPSRPLDPNDAGVLGAATVYRAVYRKTSDESPKVATFRTGDDDTQAFDLIASKPLEVAKVFKYTVLGRTYIAGLLQNHGAAPQIGPPRDGYNPTIIKDVQAYRLYEEPAGRLVLFAHGFNPLSSLGRLNGHAIPVITSFVHSNTLTFWENFDDGLGVEGPLNPGQPRFLQRDLVVFPSLNPDHYPDIPEAVEDTDSQDRLYLNTGENNRDSLLKTDDAPIGYLGCNFVRVQVGDPLGDISVEWDPVEDADQYNVYIRRGRLWEYVGSTTSPKITLSASPSDQGNGLLTPSNPLTYNLHRLKFPKGLSGASVVYGDSEADVFVELDDREEAQFAPFPQCSGSFLQRQVYAGSEAEPQTIRFSRVANFRDFSYASPRRDDDALHREISSQRGFEIRHVEDLGQNDLFVMAGSGEHRVGPGREGILTPNEIQTSQQSSYGSSHVTPLRVHNKLIAVMRGGKKVRSYRFDFDTSSYTGVELSLLAPHLFLGQEIVSMAYMEWQTPLLFVITDAGRLFTLSIEESSELLAWAEWTTGGENNRGYFRSVNTMVDRDNVDIAMFVIERPYGPEPGEGEEDTRPHRYYIERAVFGGRDQERGFEQVWVDSSTTTEGSGAEGLSHLEGQAVKIHTNLGPETAGDSRPVVDSSGNVNVPSIQNAEEDQTAGITSITAGLAYECVAEPNHLAVLDGDQNDFQIVQKCIQNIVVRGVGMDNMQVNTRTDGVLSSSPAVPYATPKSSEEISQAREVNTPSSQGYDVSIRLTHDHPEDFKVRSITAKVETAGSELETVAPSKRPRQ